MSTRGSALFHLALVSVVSGLVCLWAGGLNTLGDAGTNAMAAAVTGLGAVVSLACLLGIVRERSWPQIIWAWFHPANISSM